MKKEKLDELIKFRASKKQKNFLKEMAKKEDESLSDFLRKKSLGNY